MTFEFTYPTDAPTDRLADTIIGFWGDDDASADEPVTPSAMLARHGFVVVDVCPGDLTSYQMLVTDLRDDRLPGRPLLAISMLNGTQRAAALGRVWSLADVSYTASKLGFNEGWERGCISVTAVAVAASRQLAKQEAPIRV